MITVNRKRGRIRADNRVLMYSVLFLLCALMSVLGAGALGALVFLPAAFIAELVARISPKTFESRLSID
jgi:hypothetical protein